MAITFPSVEWFQALADMANEDEQFKKYGRMNADVGFKVGDKSYSVTFDVLTVTDVREIDEAELIHADFVIDIPADRWQGMLEDIKANGLATSEWTLNTLDLVLDEPIHANLADDGFAADKFFRYNPSLQRFFDNAAQLDTEIKLGATA
ncbi:MAG TPA: hypothetical protein QGI71_06450 [Dehalococcoidia bacterium]|jgi:hypothetical protein|nr:hypothetical protein [Dehalococcoidia bacterium]